MAQLTLFKVRDLRKKDQFKIDDAYLNGYARICGKDASLVYMSLCRHAEFNSQKAFPSQDKIAFELGISNRTVRRGLKKLMAYNIILAERVRISGKFSNYLYILLDKSEWKQSTSGQKRPMVAPADKNHRWFATGGSVPTKDNKEQRITKTKDNKEERSSKKLKPFFNGMEMRKAQRRWWCIPKEGGQWLEFAGKENQIEWK
jgi:hypothetical protein